MKTQTELIKELTKISQAYHNLTKNYTDYINESTELLSDWGRELCREQRVIASSIIDEQAGTLNEAVKLCFNAPLPEILNNK